MTLSKRKGYLHGSVKETTKEKDVWVIDYDVVGRTVVLLFRFSYRF